MRTTLVLDDALLNAAKRRAAETDTTVSEVVNDALRLMVSARPAKRKVPKLTTFGNPRKKQHVTPRQMKDVLALER